MVLRPGTAEARLLWNSVMEDEWAKYLLLYNFAVTIVGRGKKKEKELSDLDHFWRVELKDKVESRSIKHITLGELSDIMKWKLLRGKFRPLQKLVDSNGKESVIKASEKAFALLDKCNWKEALKAICVLKGIGTATASAVFAPFAENECPFMADEVIEVTAHKRDYTVGIYSIMRESLREKAAELNKEFSKDGNESSSWNAEKIGKALWTKAMLTAYIKSYTTEELQKEKQQTTQSDRSHSDTSKSTLLIPAEKGCKKTAQKRSKETEKEIGEYDPPTKGKRARVESSQLASVATIKKRRKQR